LPRAERGDYPLGAFEGVALGGIVAYADEHLVVEGLTVVALV